ncbi:energy-coupling factor transport system ATP-binding protein [Thermanaeromonas toyohensis ToBE]|uniref:Energy-coupling factor transport system ATP-binding protein n=1 Tax=Thermanaeromonas toyohensis ToBE TaxID=698762 RepID=A0A1W1VIS1_9FIRM|nr:energy-coupling factor transporter ATPase [Thermanaeromonas toyohensis]SMB93226.1 energy-coupling factor transport system ATP-binding protein [Thermanaeromonas toyohensis ToBE]
MPLFKIENLTYYYPGTEKPALRGINLEIEEGEFILITGGSGSGKSSLARVLAGLIPDFYGGKIGGRVFFQGKELRTLDRRKLAREVGIVFQDPEKQIVQTCVEAEIAFGLENLGLPPKEMLWRVAEIMSFMGLTSIKEAFTANLSGGQKQKLALASVLAMQPRVLILDEPTSQLDPVSGEDILNLIKRLNEEMSFTVILIEQRLERCFHLADRVVLMEGGEIVCQGKAPEEAREAIKKGLPFVPPVTRFFASLPVPFIPLTVKEGRKLLCSYIKKENLHGKKLSDSDSENKSAQVREASKKRNIVSVQNVWFSYPGGQEVLKDISFDVHEGEFVAIIGENGAGKSTLLKVIMGLLKPSRGKVYVQGKEVGDKGFKEIRKFTAYLSQNPNDYLFQDTVEDELLFTLRNFGLKDIGLIDEMLEKLDLQRYRKTNPRDLSTGERQRVALASVLVTKPRLIVLDEPTRGIDFRLKEKLGELLRKEIEKGNTVILVTHDVEFAAEFATKVMLMFAGRIVCDGEKHAVLGKSIFYSPQIGKLCRDLCEGVLTFAEAREKILPLLAKRLEVI